MSLSLQPSDIDTVEEAGVLDGQTVKLLRTKGGFWLSVHNGKVIAGGSHPAIVKHSISKMFPTFQPVMCKSEAFSDAVVEQHSHFLSDDLRKSGHDIYSIQTGMNIEFQITKNNLKVASVTGSVQDDSLYIDELAFPKQFTKSLASAATEKALDSNLKTIKIR
jgi:hypothetical protein